VAVNDGPLSIALPVRNGANYLAEALESVLAQDCGDWVLHVSDNASDDATADILAKFAARDSRIRPSRSAQPLSQVANMNRAVGLAETPWVRMLCHDDLLRPDCVRQTLDAIAAVKDSGVALIGNGERHLYPNGYATETRPDASLVVLPGSAVLQNRFNGTGDAQQIPSVTTATFRIEALAALGGFSERWVHFDAFAWYRLLTRCDFGFIPAQLTINRIHSDQVAIRARASLRTVRDHRAFMAEFHREFGTALGLPGWRMALIAPGLAAQALHAELRAGRPGAALSLLPRLPLAWWPLLPALTLRAWWQDRTRLAAVRKHVPLRLIYP
jgi:glycosyltransferase involved in cell wall biosynthesis